MTDPASTETYVFLDEHSPQLKAGAYTLHAALNIDADPSKKPTGEKKPSGEVDVEFWVGAERYSLGPAQVHSVYPPQGSEGAYSDCLPHIALSRDTLPWERNAGATTTPWLALLLLHPDEAARAKLEPLSLGVYQKQQAGNAPHEPGESDDDQLQVIHLDAELTKRLIPTPRELKALCHVRATLDAKGVLQRSVSVVVSKRAPSAGRNTVHLVSLENYYASRPVPRNELTCTLVSLMSWSFDCRPSGAHAGDASLAELFAKLDASWLRLPPPAARNDAAEPYLAHGRVPLPHQSRGGEAGISWYAGPLVPRASGTNAVLVSLPAGSADELLWYHEQVGMLDVSYAAAWELGRLLALEHRIVATALATWRRQQVLSARRQVERDAHGHLPQLQRTRNAPPLRAPEALRPFITELRRCEGIPFKYLVPDERMLPAESIRFFTVDRDWMRALVDSVLAMARPPDHAKGDQRSDTETELLKSIPEAPELCGFLLRSAIVSGWPGLEIEAKGSNGQAVAVHHHAQLAPSIAIYLFTEKIRSLTLRQHADTVHLTLPGKSGPMLDVPNTTSAELARSLLSQSQALEIAVGWEAG